MRLWTYELQRYADDRYRCEFETKEPFIRKVFLFKADAEFELGGYVCASDHLSGEVIPVSVRIFNIRTRNATRWIWNLYCGISRWRYAIQRVKQ